MKRSISVVLCLMILACTFFIPTEASAGGIYVPWRAVSYAKSNYTKAWACSKFVANCVAAGGFDLGDENSMTNTGSLKTALEKQGLSAHTLTLSSYKVKRSKNPELAIGDPVFCYCKNHKNYPHVLIVTGYSGDDVMFSCTNSSHWNDSWTFNNNYLSDAHKNNDSCKGQIQAIAYHLSSSTFSPSSSPASTMTYNNHIYERYDYSLSWLDAKAFCEEKGGHLVTITDAAEQDAVVGLLNGCNMGYYHIGASTTTPGNYGWSWVTGEPFSYNNWDPDAPEPSAQSDEFYSMIIGIPWPDNKQVGEWCDSQNNGDTSSKSSFYKITNGGFICEYDADTTPPTISDVSVTDVSPTGYTVTCRVSDDKGVARVSFPTWPLNGAQPLWMDGIVSNGTASFRVNVSDHNGVNGCQYVTHIYAYDDAGNVSSVGDGEYSVLLVSVPAPDTTAPTISDVSVTDVSPTGYTVTCKVSDNIGIASVKFPTWTLNNDQDDIIWSDGELEGNTATYRVEVGDHNGENGCTYRTHIYAYDLAGNHSVASVDVEVPAPTSVFDLNGYLDGVIEGGLGEYGTADVYINGEPVAIGVNDYWDYWPVGTTYEVKNIKAADGRRYNGVYSGSLSGTVGTERTNVVLSFSNIYTFTFDANGGTGSMPDMQTAINDPVVLPNCGFTKDVCLFQGWEAYRPADNKYAISDVGWCTEEEMTAAGLTPTKYPAGLSFDFNTSWTEGTTGPVTIVLRPVWLAPDFVLPTSLRAIEDEAFEGAAFSFVKLPVGTASIGSRAFANCSNLTHIYIPASATSIDPTAFAGTNGLTIHSADGSYAEFYAGKYGFAFIPVA